MCLSSLACVLVGWFSQVILTISMRRRRGVCGYDVTYNRSKELWSRTSSRHERCTSHIFTQIQLLQNNHNSRRSHSTKPQRHTAHNFRRFSKWVRGRTEQRLRLEVYCGFTRKNLLELS